MYPSGIIKIALCVPYNIYALELLGTSLPILLLRSLYNSLDPFDIALIRSSLWISMPKIGCNLQWHEKANAPAAIAADALDIALRIPQRVYPNYFFSCTVTARSSDAHLAPKLVRLPSLIVVSRRPASTPFLTRAAFTLATRPLRRRVLILSLPV